ncbi:MAG: alpha/beta hydrolase [Nitriliruptorales bacterium]|nr:alpha/beta hydrolase [Nitriliruptorales bacterium]
MTSTPPLPDRPRPHRTLGDPDSHFIEVEGVDVHTKIKGTGPPDLVLLHHFYGHVWAWRHVQDLLADQARTIAFDRPGFGLTERVHPSAWPHGNPYTRASSVQLMVGLLDHLEIDRAVLVGSSAGGTVALEAWSLVPERISGLVLLSPAVTGDVGAPEALRPLLRTAPARRLAPRIAERVASGITHHRVGRSWHDSSRVSDEDVHAYSRPLEAEGWQHGFWDVMTAEPRPRHRRTLRTITVPTLVLAGSSDRTVPPRLSRGVAAAIPTSEYRLLDGCGHTPHEECPGQVATAISEFLARLGADTDGATASSSG